MANIAAQIRTLVKTSVFSFMDVTITAGSSLFSLNALIGDSLTCSSKNSVVSANNDFTMSCNSGDLILGTLIIRHRIISPESCEYTYVNDKLVSIFTSYP